MIFNEVYFLVTLSKRMNSYTVQHISNCTGPVLANSRKNILNMHIVRGYMVKVIRMDMESEKIIDDIEMAIVNTTGARGYTTATERGLCATKKNTRCTVSELFKSSST